PGLALAISPSCIPISPSRASARTVSESMRTPILSLGATHRGWPGASIHKQWHVQHSVTPFSTLRYKVESTRSRKSLADRMAVSRHGKPFAEFAAELAEGLRAGHSDDPIAETARLKVIEVAPKLAPTDDL